MFWGASISNKSSHALTPHIAEGEDEDLGDSLHVSNASLGPKDSNDKVYVEASVNGNKFILCSLQRDKSESVRLDLYFKPSNNEEQVLLSPKGGNSEVYLTGYWEPSPDLGDDQIGIDQFGFDPSMMEEDDEPADADTETHLKQAEKNALQNVDLKADSSSSEDEAEVIKKLQQQKKQKGKAQPVKKTPPAKQESSSSDDEDYKPQATKTAAAAQDDDSSDGEDLNLARVMKAKREQKKKEDAKAQQPEKKRKVSENSEGSQSSATQQDAEGKKKRKKKNRKKKNKGSPNAK